MASSAATRGNTGDTALPHTKEDADMTSAYVSIRQHPSAYRVAACKQGAGCGRARAQKGLVLGIIPEMLAVECAESFTEAPPRRPLCCIRQHTSAYVDGGATEQAGVRAAV